MLLPGTKTCFIICGPTAVGKTDLAIELAKTLGTQIISADSRQCYRELNIGVAKPSPDQLAAIRHFFINSHSVVEEVNAASFTKVTEAAIKEMFSFSRAAVIAGGTGLYIDAFCNGLDEIPAIEPLIRDTVRKQYEEKGIDWLRDELLRRDPIFSQEGNMLNPQRMMRALEVKLSSGISIRSFQSSAIRNKPYRIIKVGLDRPRAELYERISSRVDLMIKEGLVDEVAGLLEYKQQNALNTVGYKEVISFLEHTSTFSNAINLIKQNTRRYAKRQLTWFRKDPTTTWFPADNPEAVINYCVERLQDQ